MNPAHVGLKHPALRSHDRENLQTTVEELETSNEELQVTNEELLASNEELQSTNEEQQPVTEELYTVNAEYQSKIMELLSIAPMQVEGWFYYSLVIKHPLVASPPDGHSGSACCCYLTATSPDLGPCWIGAGKVSRTHAKLSTSRSQGGPAAASCAANREASKRPYTLDSSHRCSDSWARSKRKRPPPITASAA